VGGTGKTPIVIWLADHFRNKYAIGIVSRGYAAVDRQLNDEGLEIRQRLDEIVLVQNRDRVAAARSALSQLADAALPPLIIADDAFQHRRLARDFNLVLIDATRPFGFDQLLPAGLLREPVSTLRRASAVILSRANLVEPKTRRRILKRIREVQPNAVLAETALVATGWRGAGGESLPLSFLHDQPVLAFCGIGNSGGFRDTLLANQIRIVEFVPFPDHHHFTKQDLVHLSKQAEASQCRALVCTIKDLVKLPRLVSSEQRPPIRPFLDQDQIDLPGVLALETNLEWISGRDELLSDIEQRLAEWKRTRGNQPSESRPRN
jgi:tetraacyldisaccharide 4'-kinase